MLIIFSYIVLLNIGIVMANTGKLNALLATWLPNVLLSIITYGNFIIQKKQGEYKC